MAEETDGVREAFDDALRIALTVATQLGERVGRLREQFGRQREARAVQTNRELEARFEAERGAMQASLLPLKQAGWWEHASITEIAMAREAAVAWRDYDDVARQTNADIEREVHERYGIDVSRPGADPMEVAEALLTADNERAQAVADHERDGEELVAADMLLRAAGGRDRDSDQAAVNRQASRSDYDSAARRDAFAASLFGVAEPETIAARILADGENATHPSEAIAARNAQAPKVRRPRVTREQQRQRTGIQGG
jgi:colicin import membrane protein